MTCKKNLENLVNQGVNIIEPQITENKANLAKTHNIVIETIRKMNKSILKNKRILVTAGPTPGKIDNVRLITNRFKGRLGLLIAEELYLKGANVKLILGSSGINFPDYINTSIIRSFEEYYSNVMTELKNDYDVGIFSSAVADYVPSKVEKGKIPSKGAINSIPLTTLPIVV